MSKSFSIHFTITWIKKIRSLYQGRRHTEVRYIEVPRYIQTCTRADQEALSPRKVLARFSMQQWLFISI